jgi:hypothetical protein
MQATDGGHVSLQVVTPGQLIVSCWSTSAANHHPHSNTADLSRLQVKAKQPAPLWITRSREREGGLRREC